ncbi:hypothetical protein B0E51_10170 [Rhodanobacter sp. C05]|nr:hypothetical protein B0E51_10170 [Rhodanobacter sp. C05]
MHHLAGRHIGPERVWQNRRLGFASTRNATSSSHRGCADNGAGAQRFHPVTGCQWFRDDAHGQRFFRAATRQRWVFRLGELNQGSATKAVISSTIERLR